LEVAAESLGKVEAGHRLENIDPKRGISHPQDLVGSQILQVCRHVSRGAKARKRAITLVRFPEFESTQRSRS
jgi:hypothetical protein